MINVMHALRLTSFLLVRSICTIAPDSTNSYSWLCLSLCTRFLPRLINSAIGYITLHTNSAFMPDCHSPMHFWRRRILLISRPIQIWWQNTWLTTKSTALKRTIGAKRYRSYWANFFILLSTLEKKCKSPSEILSTWRIIWITKTYLTPKRSPAIVEKKQAFVFLSSSNCL